MKGLSQKITEASANLQGSTFTTGRTAEQMGDQRRYQDQWCYFDRNMVVRLDGGQNQIGSCIVVLTAYPVEKNNQQTGKGQQVNEYGVSGSVAGHKTHGIIKKCSDGSYEKACKDGCNQPADQ